MFEVRGYNGYDVDAASREADFAGEGPSMTKQSFKDEADINTIVDRFLKTGAMPEDVRMPQFGDFTDVVDFRGAMDSVVRARESFDAMPAAVRARFHNDPAEFVDFCMVESNWDEALEMGLISEEAVTRRAEKAAALQKEHDDKVRAEFAAESAKAASKPSDKS